MLEKIGLPPKPSMRGGSWVVDASHCQGCSSQFSFINRKHHCRRCGGIFCNSCTQQRMVLRGQGDSAVRICDPCKNLEDAARFESRYGRKNRTVRDGSKLESRAKDEVNLHSSSLPGTQPDASPVTSSSSKQTGEADLSESSVDARNNCPVSNEVEPMSPEELRQKAVEEKKQHKILKGEGKPEEALRAFKRGKELERQAHALEIALRKSRKKPSQSKNDSGEGFMGKRDATLQSTTAVKDDLLSELKDLGWADGDLQASEQKRENLSLEGELSNIIREVLPKSSSVTGSKVNNSQILAHKKKAIGLKREGKLSEAKEELKKAKVLERELEEQELLGQAHDDSDDELSALVRNMDDHKQDDSLEGYGHDVPMNFDFLSLPDDDSFVDNFDVNDDDMNDPEMAAALKSFGWSEEDASVPQLESRESLQSEILQLKKEALDQKRAGNMAEAVELLRKAKQHEKALETADNEPSSLSISSNRPKPMPIPEVNNEIVAEIKDPEIRPKPKSKLLVQRELLAVKKKALALRREGRLEEADEELSKGKDLERQLQEMESTQNLMPTKVESIEKISHQSFSTEEDDVEAISEVTENDMDDPSLLSALKNLGWAEEEVVRSIRQANAPKIHRSNAEIQRELLGIKRKALAFRREGKTQEADEELERAKPLEEQLQAMEAQPTPEDKTELKTPKELEPEAISNNESALEAGHHVFSPRTTKQELDVVASVGSSSHDLRDSGVSSSSSSSSTRGGKIYAVIEEVDGSGMNPSQKIESLDDQLRARKRKAVALKREGKLAEAREELRQAKLMEKSLEEEKPTPPVESSETSGPTTSGLTSSGAVSSRHVSARDRFKLQQEVLSHKRLALRLKREGRIEESEAEFVLAKSLETQLEEMDNSKSSSLVNANNASDDGSVLEDLLDPQLLSALRSIGWNESDIHGKVEPKPSSSTKVNVVSPEKLEVKKVNPNSPAVPAKSERAELEEQINAEKRRALALKRAGKQGEALEALRLAKSLEKKLISLG